MGEIQPYQYSALTRSFELAQEAAKAGEVPVGAVITYQKKIIAEARNSVIEDQSITSHAELLCIEKASRVLKNYRLLDCELFTSLEPCTMCSGAIIHARISSVYYLAPELKLPALTDVLALKRHNHVLEAELIDIEELDSSNFLKEFFAVRRKK